MPNATTPATRTITHGQHTYSIEVQPVDRIIGGRWYTALVRDESGEAIHRTSGWPHADTEVRAAEEFIASL